MYFKVKVTARSPVEGVCVYVCARESLPFMASAVWMSSVTAPATRLEQAASCCFSSAVGFCRTCTETRLVTGRQCAREAAWDRAPLQQLYVIIMC